MILSEFSPPQMVYSFSAVLLMNLKKGIACYKNNVKITFARCNSLQLYGLADSLVSIPTTFNKLLSSNYIEISWKQMQPKPSIQSFACPQYIFDSGKLLVCTTSSAAMSPQYI